MASATSRCCAPSCRSRSIRRRSASAASTTRSRLISSSVTRAARSRRGPSSRRDSAASATASPRVSCAAASSTTRPITAEAVILGVPPSTKSPILAPPLGSNELYSGSVSRTRPAAQAATQTVAATALTGSLSSP